MPKRVCIVGAGAAGLAAVKNVNESDKLVGICFEKTGNVGGLWKYSDVAQSDEQSTTVHSTVYKGLRTNLPREIMGYLDYPMLNGKSSFLCHEDVQEFLERYAETFDLLRHIQFKTSVTSIQPFLQPVLNGSNLKETITKWEVIVQDSEGIEKKHIFDAVMICNGHYWKGVFPDLKNMDSFKGQIIHSKDYRIPEPYLSKRVVVVGSGPSGIDISLEIAQIASKVTLTMRTPPYPGTLPKNIQQAPEIKEITSEGVILIDDEFIPCDVILLSTGYEYFYPFLTPECGLEVQKGKKISSLYRHLINVNHPSMALLGIPIRVCPFILFDCQSRYFVKYLEGRVKVPSKPEMLAEIDQESEYKDNKGLPLSRYHELEHLQWTMHLNLLKDAGQPPDLLKPYVRKIYEAVAKRRRALPQIYRNDQVIILNDTEFKICEASL